MSAVVRDLEQAKLGTGVVLEAILEDRGILSYLENSGIVPTADPLNPYDPVHEEELNQEWWAEHPEEEMQFSVKFEKREEVLRYIYIGVILGRHYPDLYGKRA